MFGSITRKANAELANVEGLRAEVFALKTEVQALKRGQLILDAQFEELIDKAMKKWARAKMEIVRDEEHAQTVKARPRAKSINSILNAAVQKSLEQ